MEIRERLENALRDRYRIEGLLGEGGMARVYLAEDLKHGRRVALKVLRPEISSAMGADRFLREIEVAARLNHPNILALHDSGEADGLLYFVMPHVEGESLRERLDREVRLPVDEALRIAAEVGDALDYAHAQGLVHRDIKPENILFQAGHALVADFGIARVASQAGDRLTQTGVSVGTLDYMSPEQLDDSREVDGRADVYALGCVLHEMLSGEKPFHARTPQAALARKLTGEVRDLTEIRKDVPLTVQPVVARALSVEPVERFDTAGLFIGALSEASTRVAVEVEERRRRRRRTARRAASAMGVALVGVVGWFTSQLFWGPSNPRILVLPLDNARQDTAQAYVVQGVYTDLVREMAGAVRVIGIPTAEQVAERGLSLREISRELEVAGVVTGRASLEDGEVVVALELSDPRSQEMVWSQEFRADPGRILDVYHGATLAIADWVGADLSEEVRARLASSQEVDPRVQQALWQARFHWQKLTAEGIDNAEDYFDLALEFSDSTSADAWMGLAQVWAMRAQMGLVSGEEALARGDTALARAQELDPGLRTEDAAVRAWLEWDWERSMEAYRAASEANPTDAVTRAYLGHILLYMGESEDAWRQMEQAVATDPFNPLVQGLYGQFLNFERRYDEAEAAFQRALERDPENPVGLSNFRTTYHHQGRYEEAMPIWRQYYESRGDTAAVRALDQGYGAGGYAAALTAVAEEFESRDNPALQWQIATLYTRAGERDRALEYLERALAVHDANLPYITIDPLFDFLRDEPRFQALVDSLGLPES